MQSFTEFDSFKDLLTAAGMPNDPGIFQTQAFNRFISLHTNFTSFSDMCLKAKAEQLEATEFKELSDNDLEPMV
ncbi:hypothetical protein [Periweissella cryptocerci]|nr:hypothetical protein [Periweissella cryptocerci]